MPTVEQIEKEIEDLSVVISASDDWAKGYSKDPETHARLLRAEAKLEKNLRTYFRELANVRLVRYINWYEYHMLKAAEFNVDVVVDDLSFEGENTILFKAIESPVTTSIALGAQASETLYKLDLGLNQSSTSVLNAARKHIADLVTNVNETTKDRIRQSLRTSIELGETQTEATARLLERRIINDPKRAAVIARTEAVNSFGKGITLFGEKSGAIGHEWQTNPGACMICLSNEDEGVIPFGEAFSSGATEPAAHPNCRCYKRLVYTEEAKKLGLIE